MSGITGTCFMIFSYMRPDSTVKTAALVAAGTNNILNRTNTLLNHGYGEKDEVDQGTCFTDRCSHFSDRVSPMFHHKKNCLVKDDPCYTNQWWTRFTDEYMNKKTNILIKKGRDDLNNLLQIMKNLEIKL